VSENPTDKAFILHADEELKDLHVKQGKIHFIAKLFKEREEWKKNLFTLKEFKVLKMPRVMQSIFYFLGYEREAVCEKNTNKFFWKKAKLLLDDEFLNRLANYNSLGPKDKHLFRY